MLSTFGFHMYIREIRLLIDRIFRNNSTLIIPTFPKLKYFKTFPTLIEVDKTCFIQIESTFLFYDDNIFILLKKFYNNALQLKHNTFFNVPSIHHIIKSFENFCKNQYYNRLTSSIKTHFILFNKLPDSLTCLIDTFVGGNEYNWNELQSKKIYNSISRLR